MPQSSFKIAGKPDNYQFYLPNFWKISHKLLRPSQLMKCKENFELSTLQKYIRLFPLHNVAAYCKSSNTQSWVTKLSKILANNMIMGEGLVSELLWGIEIYFQYVEFNGHVPFFCFWPDIVFGQIRSKKLKLLF